MSLWLSTDFPKWSHVKWSLWSTSEKYIIINGTSYMRKYSMPLILHCLVPCMSSALWQRALWANTVLCHCSVVSCSFTFLTKPSLGFASYVSTAAATCSRRWPPQPSPLPQEHLACGSLSTCTEHRSCRRQRRPAAHSPAAPKIGEIHTLLL